MEVLETTAAVDLPDRQVAVCGDWHGDVEWLRTVRHAVQVAAPGVRTILQLGDWGMDTEACDAMFFDSGIDRVYVTLGNHEPWAEITPLLDAHPGQAVRVSEVTWLLPRPARLQIAGREILSLGGAASVDREWRVPGVSWWPDEAITDEHVADAIAGGRADVMLTHESPARTPLGTVNQILRSNPLGFPKSTLIESAASRSRITRVWDAVHPRHLLHGHMHVAAAGLTHDGRHVTSLAANRQQAHLAILDLATLSVDIPTLHHDGSSLGSGH